MLSLLVTFLKDGFAQRKEERFVDYYRVPQGKPIKDGQFISHGIHLTSYDKTERKGKGVSALSYHRDDRSDSTPPGKGTPHYGMKYEKREQE